MAEREAPHAGLAPADEREALALSLLDALWRRYRARVPYVGVYEQAVARAGARFRNDHVAFRTLATQQPGGGIAAAARVFEALGWRPAGAYAFEDKKLAAVHYRHPRAGFPKIFVSELQTWRLSARARTLIADALADQRPPLADAVLAELAAAPVAENLAELEKYFEDLPWSPPEEAFVRELAKETQYGAWALLHGLRVNHFTAAVHSHGGGPLEDIEKTAAALKALDVPMKDAIEGAPGSRLRQTATTAAEAPAAVRGGTIRWPYGYFELAERPLIDGERFEGFLGPQAAELFDMTRRGEDRP